MGRAVTERFQKKKKRVSESEKINLLGPECRDGKMGKMRNR